MAEWENQYYPAGTGLIDQPSDTAEWTNTIYPAGTGESDLPAAQTGESIDYSSIAQSLGLGLVDTFLPNFDTTLGATSQTVGLYDNVTESPGTKSSWGDVMKNAFKSISGDTWAKILGGAAAGMGQAYMKGKELDIFKQNADTSRMNADLAKSKDKRAAESAKNLEWRMGLMGAKK